MAVSTATLCRFLFFAVMVFISGTLPAKSPVVIGVLAPWGADDAYNTWTPTADYLNKRLPDYQFRIRPLSLPEMEAAVAASEVDFIITNSGDYVTLEAKYGITRMATLVTLEQGQPTTRFGAVIFTRADRMDIKRLSDLKGKSFMAVKESAFGGFQMAWMEFVQKDIDPFSDFSRLEFSGFPQDKVVEAVLRGEVDAGTVRTGTLERMAAEGKIQLKNLFVIPHDHVMPFESARNHPDFPFLYSTDLYPEWPFAQRKGVESALAGKVGVALLSMPKNSPAAVAARSHGWTVPLDYQAIHFLMKTLSVGPYKDYQLKSLVSLMKRYWWVLVIVALMIPYIAAYVVQLRGRARSIERHLEETQAEWIYAMDSLDDVIFLEDLEGKLIRANKAFYRMINKTPKEVVGKHVHKYFHPGGTSGHCHVRKACEELKDEIVVMEADDPANEMGFPMETTIRIVRDYMGKPTGVLQRKRNLSQVRERERELQRAQEKFSGLLESAPDAMIICDRHGKIVLVNAQCERVFGFKREELIGEEVEILIPPELYDRHASLRKGFAVNPGSNAMGVGRELVAQRRNGEQFHVEISLSPLQSEDDFLITAIVRDITARKEAERELQRLASFPELSPVPVVEITPAGQVTFVNPMAMQLFPDLREQGFSHPVLKGLESQVEELKKLETPLICDIVIDGYVYEQNISFIPEINVIRVYFWDITSMHDLTKEIAYRAGHDALTGLINRHEFDKLLDQAISSAYYDDKQHAFCYMDLDQFKVVNDTCGHIAGDELLKQLALVIKDKLRGSDIFGRLGGDEFGLLMFGCDLAKAEELVKVIRGIVSDFRFTWEDKVFSIGASFGLVPITRDSGTAAQLLSAADSACYLAKDHGRNQICIHTPDNAALAKRASEMNWTHKIQQALEGNKFVLHYQPIIALDGPYEKKCEILIRMTDDNGELILPSVFIASAERYNMMSSIDLWVVRNTLLALANGELSEYHCAINLSGQTLGDMQTMEFVLSAIGTSGVDPARIGFEVTETAIITNISAADRYIRQLRSLGCQIALDDFGSGLSSFAYLKNLPVDVLKIDGVFVRDITKDPVSRAMVKSVTDIGHLMGLKTIAEFVEDAATLNMLTEMGVDYAQGYLISRPAPLEEFLATTEYTHRKHMN
ncbi:MAG: EAL domain-containing protein [Gammaproteobacteria bacterium]|nr:EAL domain-containing protein [Gammaproteobacteria bacterium]